MFARSPCTSVIALLVPLAVTLAPRLAAADDPKTASDARFTMYEFAHTVGQAKAHGFFEGFDKDLATCRAAIVDGTAAGLKPVDTFDDDSGPVLWKNAGAICDEYARLAPMKAAIDVVAPDYNTIVIIRGDGKGISDMSGDAYRANVETAKKCMKAVDQALKAGAPADVKFAPNGNEHDTLVSLTEVRAQCDAFTKLGGKLAAADDAARAAAEAALRQKYATLGITGDRLRYLMDSDNHIYVMGKGCKSLDMAGKKTAPVIYEMQDGDTYWVVYKMTFKGDKLLKTTEKRFNKAGRPWSCK